jgi:hypothetical protein
MFNRPAAARFHSSFAFGFVVMALVAAEPAATGTVAHAQAIVSPCGGGESCPSRILFGGATDTLDLHADLVGGMLDPTNESFTLTLSNANGVIFMDTLAPGEIQQIDNRFQFRDPNAEQTGGFGRVTLRPQGGNVWRVDLIGYGDLADATLSEMTVTIQAGNDTFTSTDSWQQREFGWINRFPATAPTPTPTGGPTATPTPEPTPSPTVVPPTPTPEPTPTAEPTASPSPSPSPPPYGTVFEAFVAPPASLLR